MRLTLRTLLAYRDGVLSAADAEDMHQRIHQSEDAANLLKRIDAIASELQKVSPRIVDKGLGGDPNSIAEYLDDVLQAEKVPELERICLESNVYLSELASCHSLLSSALHTRVRVPDELRTLAKRVGTPAEREELKAELASRRQVRNPRSKKAVQVRADQPHAKATVSEPLPASRPSDNGSPKSEESQLEESVQVQAPMVASGGESIKQQGLNLEGAALAHEVPEYLMGKGRANWKIPLAIIGLFALFAFLVWQALGPMDRVRELFVASNSEQEAGTPTEGEQELDVVNGTSEDSVEGNDPADEDAADADAESTEQGADLATDLESDSADGANVSVEPATGEATPSSPTNKDLSADSATTPANGSANDPIVDNADPGKVQPPLSELTQWIQAVDEGKASVFVAEPGGQIEQIGPGADINDGSTVYVPPHNFATFTSATLPTCKFSGPSRFVAAKDHLDLQLGRIILTRSAQVRGVNLKSAVGNVQLSFLQPNSTIAAELSYRAAKHGPATEPANQAAVLILAAVDGAFRAKTDQGGEIDIQLGEGLAIVQGQQPRKFRMQVIPDWYRMRPIRPIDFEATLELNEDLKTTRANQSIQDTLVSLTKSRRPEEAALAIQILLMHGDWKPLVDAGFLTNSRMSIHWLPTLALARQLLAMDPKSAEELKRQLSSIKDGDKVFDRIVGLPIDRLDQAGLGELINGLNSENMALRVASFQLLYRLTGKKLGFKPAVPNSASVLMWRRELSKKRLEIQMPRDLIWERVDPGPRS